MMQFCIISRSLAVALAIYSLGRHQKAGPRVIVATCIATTIFLRQSPKDARWMMWNWLSSALATGATIVLYGGAPSHPHLDSLWRMAARERVTVFGTSPKYLSSLEKAAVRPRE